MNKATLIAIIVLSLLVLGAAASATTGTRKGSSSQSDRKLKYEFTITAQSQSRIGLERIVYSNQNTAQSMNIFPNDLPFKFKFAENDVLKFTVIPTSNYQLNTWILGDGDIASDNPLLLQPDGNFSMELWLMLNTTTTP